jgi:hypothetical protein
MAGTIKDAVRGGEVSVSKEYNLIAITFSSVMVVLLTTGTQVFSQAGSAGGSIGKKDKSISSDQERSDIPSRPKSPVAPRLRRRVTADAPSHQSDGAGGRWNWQAKCQGGNIFQGVFEIGSVSDGNFTGSFLGDLPGPITRGRLSGNHITFVRSVLGFEQPWRGTVSSGQMSGNISGMSGDICSFTASR